MKKRIVALFAALSCLVLAAAPVGAITYGEPDDGEHPYVGFILFFNPVSPGWFSCSGTLLDETTFLTAGHCAFDIGTDGAVTPGGSGGNDVWATFDEVVDLSQFPARADFPDEATLYAARSAWLDANLAFITGTAFPHPDYDDFAEFPNNHDVGVVELDEDWGITAFGELASLGTLNEVTGTGKDHNKVLIETAGYGIQEVHPKPMNVDERWKSTSAIVNLESHLTGDWNVLTSNNPSPVNGEGGTCFGDSGGGVFLDNTNTVVAVVSFGFNGNCKGADYSARVDVPDAQDFILPFVGD